MKKTTLAILSFAIAAVAAIGFQNVIIRGDVKQDAVIIRGDAMDNEQLAVIIRGDAPNRAAADKNHTPNENSAIVRGLVAPSGNSVIIRGGSQQS